MKPLAIDLFCGLGGWTDGLLAEGYDVIGFDIERHVYGEDRYPGLLVIQDVTTLHGAQFKNADLIVASPPCQGYSYRAMPWKKAKALPPPDNSLFEACFRIQREACEAAGRHIPLIVENVRGAQKWVGRARWNFGSFYLWGDVPALMPPTFKGTKNNGGSWFNIAHNTTSGKGQNPDGRKLRDQDGYERNHPRAFGWKIPRTSSGNPGRKQPGLSGARPGSSMRDNGRGGGGSIWFQEGAARSSSKSNARKFASAMIAKIPLALSRHIAATFRPQIAQAAE